MGFTPEAIERFRNADHRGLTFKPDAMGVGGTFESGRFVIFALRCCEGVIQEIRFECFNCLAAIASAEWVCETLEMATAEAALEIEVDTILDALGGLPASRLFSAYLVRDALKIAVCTATERGLLS